jgi:diacylglycerol kinase (ATP)
MIIFVNPLAGGGKSLSRWRIVAPELKRRFPQMEIQICEGRGDISLLLRARLADGHSHFVAAGGDGTVNDLLTAFMSLPAEKRPHLTMGAIGLGSSNDFHKPILSSQCIEGTPCLLDPSSAQRRDVGVVRFQSGASTVERDTSSSTPVSASPRKPTTSSILPTGAPSRSSGIRLPSQ